MIPDILQPGLRLVVVGTALTEESEQLGFYHLGPKERIWYLLQYGGLTPTPIFTPEERKILLNAKKGNVLNDMYRQLFFEKKQSALLKRGIGITVLNRRVLATIDDDPAAMPTREDVKEFIDKMKVCKPRVVAFLTPVEVFEECFKPMFPSANRERGKQDFTIGKSEVWLAGNTLGKTKDLEILEELFDQIGKSAGDVTGEA